MRDLLTDNGTARLEVTVALGLALGLPYMMSPSASSGDACLRIICANSYVAYWHKAEVTDGVTNVRFGGETLPTRSLVPIRLLDERPGQFALARIV
jgi:hypothetical protein